MPTRPPCLRYSYWNATVAISRDRMPGPLNTAPSPQGRPTFVQAGGSPRGRAFAAKHADSIIASCNGVAGMKQYRDDVRGHAVCFGRNPDCHPGDEEAERAEAAFAEHGFWRTPLGVDAARHRWRQTLGGHDLGPLRPSVKSGPGARRQPVIEHGAGAAEAVFAPDRVPVRAGSWRRKFTTSSRG